jgi:hypothetical protein
VELVTLTQERHCMTLATRRMCSSNGEQKALKGSDDGV